MEHVITFVPYFVPVDSFIEDPSGAGAMHLFNGMEPKPLMLLCRSMKALHYGFMTVQI